jgi:hypothetical protein
LVVVLRKASSFPPPVQAIPLTEFGTSATCRGPLALQTSIDERSSLPPILGACDTTAIDAPSLDQAREPSMCLSEPHHHAPPVPSAPTTNRLVSSGSTTVRTWSSGSGSRGDARTAKRAPSGEICAEWMPRGSGMIRAGVLAATPAASATVASCCTALTS